MYATKPNNLKKSKIIKKLNLQLPKNVVLIQVQGLSKPQTSVYGGLTVKEPSLTPCTTGFSVISDSTISGAPIGTRGITTAGHCDSPLTYNGTTLTQRKKVDQGRLDIQWLTNSNLKPTNRVQWGPNNLTRDIIGEKNYSAQLKAERVCKYGITTGYTCGTIDTKWFKPADHIKNNIKITHTTTFIRVKHDNTSNLSSGGDSGGPWFMGPIAYGTHVGELFAPDDKDAFYMPIGELFSLGVSVLTIP